MEKLSLILRHLAKSRNDGGGGRLSIWSRTGGEIEPAAVLGAQKNRGEGGYAGDRLGKKLGPIDGFVLGDGSEDARQGADAEGGVVRDTNALVAGLMGLKD